MSQRVATPRRGKRKSPGRGAPGQTRMPRVEREREMVDVASALFAERGFDGCSMDEIAAASGVTKPMLYAYFDSKEGLFAACSARAAEQLQESLRGVSRRDDLDPAEQMWRGFLEVFAFVDKHHDAWLLLYPDGRDAAGPLGAGAAAARDAMGKLLGELFARTSRAAGLGEEAIAHSDAVGRMVTATTIAAASEWARRGDEPRELAALRLMNLLWVGCGGMLNGQLWLPRAMP